MIKWNFNGFRGMKNRDSFSLLCLFLGFYPCTKLDCIGFKAVYSTKSV
ncbi:hypothetical protein HNP92_001836 [Methanococcus maripaludis]|uniref:Uncharacterized protein n=1 Tax=Methanococcus maripaludis TaxID=39152 RepID=A0A7J9S9D5_METMI|nr:hypothetical protein [Methanococcus maripaludis]MBA2853836.1 hypothetical protein [Methanococcus maripaludis]MBB6402513.1 hypothetical protein [Methanococcus maripaludis]